VVKEINLFRERRTNQSKGCGFVTMETRAQAVAAMEGLDEKHTLVRGWWGGLADAGFFPTLRLCGMGGVAHLSMQACTSVGT
jgi:RNA recognition motif-containing protein